MRDEHVIMIIGADSETRNFLDLFKRNFGILRAEIILDYGGPEVTEVT